MKIGLKLWSTNKDLFPLAIDLYKEKKIDFLELYIVPDHLEGIEVLKQMPVFLHAPHTAHGFNVFGLKAEKVELFKEQVLKTADFFDSKFIILHPGIGGDKDIFKKNVTLIKDKRILIENMSKIGFVEKTGGVVCFGHSLEQLKFIKQLGFNFCLDFAHAALAAHSLKRDYKEFITELIQELNPSYFHISGMFVEKGLDAHLDLWKGDLDVKWALDLVKDGYVVLETPKKDGLSNDLKNIEYLHSLK